MIPMPRFIVTALMALFWGIHLGPLTGEAFPAPQFTYFGSLQFATGKYIFTNQTSSLTVNNGLGFKSGRLYLSAGVPVVLQNTSWISTTGAGMVPSGGEQNSVVHKAMEKGRITLPDNTVSTQIGISDPLLHCELLVIRETRAIPSLSLTAGLKIPTADMERGFGTGEWDVAAGISLIKSIRRTMILLDLSKWYLGDLPDLVLEDPIVYSAALGYIFKNGRYGLVASFYGSTSVLPDADPPLQLGLGINSNLNDHFGLNFAIIAGLTDTAPDFSLSLGWRLR